ncbi:MAG: acetyl/propionyl/methylcrotonyl-CoA carboxylase subunit alpha [Pseudomonadota bacterium]
MFKKILIANRGEIACRVIKTAKKMGIKTVAVYSDADEASLAVEMADEAIRLGPPPAAQSYLLADRIIEACKATDAEAVHPGFGFLSERAEFVETLEAAGIAFIGPGVRAIAAMGDKIESKKLAAASGVSTVPGYVGEIADTDGAVKIAEEIGYPVMIKASAGGGGKGMRIAHSRQDVVEGFSAARNEAMSSFGDDRIFIEKFVEQPRHIEIQVLGDSHGNVIYLGERECSIQRRHQKVIEEAPSPFVDPEMRKAMGEQAVTLARAVDYKSAGTVEFIVGADKSFYFLEMNTRLQVEHPVTEMITGIDLVEQMIRVAYGEKLTLTQDDIELNGWAIESRVYAEDPYRGFLPSIGRLTMCRQPEENAHVRVDTGVNEGSEISMFYDPMIAKLVTHDATRDAAIDQMARALDNYVIRGVGHNLHFLSAVMDHPRFRSGALTTGFIAEEYPDGFEGAPADQERMHLLIGLATLADVIERERQWLISGQLNGDDSPWPHDRIVHSGTEKWHTAISTTDDSFLVTVDGHEMAIVTEWRPGSPLIVGTRDGTPFAVEIMRKDEGLILEVGGTERLFRVFTESESKLFAHMIEKLPPDTSKLLLCPMPGLVVSINVEKGDTVAVGQPLAIIEAMKMENILRAERAGTVTQINVAAGDPLAVDEVIMSFE